MTDLSKALDCLSHKLIKTKQNAYGFNKQALKLMNNNNLSERKQRTKLGVHYSSSYADDNTPYTQNDSTDQVISRLEETVKSLFKWLSDNHMKANPDKCNLLLNNSYKKTNVGEFEIESSTE